MGPRLLLLILLVDLLGGQVVQAQFSEVLPGTFDDLWGGSTSWADYNNDGHMDVMVSGSNQSFVSRTRLYENDGTGGFSEVLVGAFRAFLRGRTSWADYDNDGNLDVLVTGSEVSILYANNGAGGFSEVSSALFGGIADGSMGWEDYDNDGDLDLLLSGGGIARLYSNQGSGEFIEVLPTTFADEVFSSIGWADYDNDGDSDVLWSSGSFFVNNGTGEFLEILPETFDFGGSDIAWSDYNNDGYEDALLTGSIPIENSLLRQPITKLFVNDGFGGFSELDPNVFGAIGDGSIAWADYNNDGHSDVLIAGQDDTFSQSSRLYQNDGLGSFNEVLPGTFEDLSWPSLAWADYDNDNDLDIMITGRDDDSNVVTLLYSNDGTTFNSPPNAPTGLSTSISGDELVFSWTASTDSETPSASLTYDLYIHNTTTGENLKMATADLASGKLTIPKPGSIQSTTWTLKGGFSAGEYTWGVQAIDGSYSGSAFATGSFSVVSSSETQILSFGIEGQIYDAIINQSDHSVTIALPFNTDLISVQPNISVSPGASIMPMGPQDFTDPVTYTVTAENGLSSQDWKVDVVRPQLSEILANTFNGVSDGSMAWADYDNDGDMDVIVSGREDIFIRGFTRLYNNNGIGDFTEVWPGTFAPVYSSDIAWSDYDNDGDLDILISGRTRSLSGGTTGVSYLYSNDGVSGFNLVLPDTFDGVITNAISWADHDGDGDLDLMIMGLGNDFKRTTKLYDNEGVDGFSEVFTSQFNIGSDGDLAWSDYDNDGDPDVMICGAEGVEGIHCRLYANNGSEGFSEVFPGTFAPAVRGEIGWADYDNDGDEDVLIIGGNTEGSISKLYANNGDHFAEVFSGTFEPVTWGADLAWSDYDNDGDPDLVITGLSKLNRRITHLYRNDQSGFTLVSDEVIQGVRDSDISWVDYDNDRDQDLMITGRNELNSKMISQLYLNNGTKLNTIPEAPFDLAVSASSEEVKFSWTAPADNETPSLALSYDLFLINSETDEIVKSVPAEMVTGERRLQEQGAIQTTFWTLEKSLPVGNYTWGVQAIDGAHSGSAFTTQEFIISNNPVITSPSTAEATEDQLFTYTATATDEDDDPITFSFSNLPDWLSSEGSTVSGTPTEGIVAGDFEITAWDGNSGFANHTVAITVEAINDAPSISEVNDIMIEDLSQPVEINVAISDVDNQFDELAFSVSTSGNVLDPTDFTLTGNEPHLDVIIDVEDKLNGEDDVTLTVSDGESSASTTFKITIANFLTQLSNQPIDIELFPNPANQMLFIELPFSSTENKIRVIDSRGKTVENRNMDNSDLELDVSRYEPGVYLIHVKSGNNLQIMRFIKR